MLIPLNKMVKQYKYEYYENPSCWVLRITRILFK